MERKTHWAWPAFTSGRVRARAPARPLRAGVRDLRARLPRAGRLGVRAVPDRRGAPRPRREPLRGGDRRRDRRPPASRSCSSSTRAGSAWTSRGSRASSCCRRRARIAPCSTTHTQRRGWAVACAVDDDLPRGHRPRARRARRERAAPARAAARAAPARRALRAAGRGARAHEGAPARRGQPPRRRVADPARPRARRRSRRASSPRWSARSTRGARIATTSPLRWASRYTDRRWGASRPRTVVRRAEPRSRIPRPSARPSSTSRGPRLSRRRPRPQRAERTAITPDPARSLSSVAGAQSLTTAADAMRDEEVERTRLFIRMGWGISVASIGVVPILPAPLVTQIAMVAAMVLGIVVSFGFHQRFADPAKYTESALVTLAVMCIVNAHVAVLYFGALTISPVIVVVGIHFVARTEAERAARVLFATALACYGAIAVVLVPGLADDPGVFATGAPLSASVKLVGALFVLGTYVLAYATARVFRSASLASIEELAKATRLASQREALMDELRADLERALRVGGPGRYTEQVVGDCGSASCSGAARWARSTRRCTSRPASRPRSSCCAASCSPIRRRSSRFLREARAGGALDCAERRARARRVGRGQRHRAVPRDGAPARRDARRDPAPRRAPAARRPARARPRRRRRHRRRRGRGHRASRRQAAEPVPLRRRRRRMEAPRLRRRDVRRGLGHAHPGRRRRDAGVHGARTGAGQAGRPRAPTSTRSPPSRIAA